MKTKSPIRDWIEAIISAFIIAMLIRIFVVEPFKIPTGSMRPTLKEGDIILVNKFIYGVRIPFINLRLPAIKKPKRGEVIVFIFPDPVSTNPKKNFIKRLVALQDETVEIKNGAIYINQKPLLDVIFKQNADGSLRYYYNRGEFEQEDYKFVVPKDSFFVLGDNSVSSQDSRYWGQVPYKNLVGQAILIYWPPHRIRIIK